MTSLQQSKIIGCLEEIWTEIQKEVTDLPDAVFTVGSGSSARGSLVWGHYAYHRWVDGIKDESSPVNEIFLSGEGFKRGAEATMTTLLHEATHALAGARGIRDTSVSGRYHNKRFNDLANKTFGIRAEENSYLIGWSACTMSDVSRKRWESQIKRLDKVLQGYRNEDSHAVATPVKATRPRKVFRCGCGREMKIPKDIQESGSVLCGLCGKRFEEVDDGE